MTPAELITRRLRSRIISAGATVPVQSLLLEALDGERHEAPSSGIAVNVHVSGQLVEPLPLFTFAVTVALTVSLDDDKDGSLFAANYGAIWAAFAALADGDACTELGDENDADSAHVFAVDGFQLTEGDAPDFAEDDNGGVWATSFTATVTGRASVN